MKTKKTILSLAISALLAAGATSYSMSSYAGSDDSSKVNSDSKSKVEEKKVDAPKAQAVNKSDSDKRSSGDSGNKSHQKVTICHVPPGNPSQKHTIHIAFSAWAAHKAHTNNKGPDYADYLGSCNSKTDTTAKETLHIISGCTGAARETLETKVQTYFEPITVADSALDDESVVTAMSQCLDNGDSSDSGKSDGDSGKSAASGKGKGYDSVSDSGNHHRIRSCLNRDAEKKADSNNHHGQSDSDKDDNNLNYHQKLKNADSGHDTAKGIKDPVVVSDSSLDDSGVFKEFKKCTQDSSNANKIDSAKTGKKMGDSGHRQYSLKSCGDTQDQKVRDAIAAYKAKTSTKDIILTASSYNDVTVKAAVDACVSTGAKDSVTDSFSPNVALHNVDIKLATVTNAVISNNVITGGTITAGTSDTANVIGGTISGGTVSGGTTSGTTLTDATITGATVSTGVSGRLNFRENTSPIKEKVTE